MNRIESGDNKKIKRLKSLDRKKVRNREDLFFIEGRKLLDEALSSRIRITEVYVSDTYYQNNMSYVDKLTVKNLYLVRDGILESLSYMKIPKEFWHWEYLLNSMLRMCLKKVIRFL